MSEEQEDYLWRRRHRVLRRVEISVCYHRKRERFFEFLDRGVKAIAIIGSSIAFADLLRVVGGGLALKICAATVAVTTTISLVFGFAERARQHSEIARAFLELEAQIVARGERSFDENDLDLWEARVRTLEASEPAALNALVVVCQNEIAIAAGNIPTHIPWYQRLLAHFWSFSVPHDKSKDPKPANDRA